MRIAWKPLGWGLFIVLVLAIVLCVLVGRQLWNEALQQNGIKALEWQGLSLSLSGFSVRELELIQSLPSRNVSVQARELTLAWRWPAWGEGWQPRLTALAAEYLNLDWQEQSGEQQVARPPEASAWPPDLPSWLPAEVTVQRFEVTLPCETGRCPLAGSLTINSSQPDWVTEAGSASLPALSQRLPVTASLQLDHEGHSVNMLATLDGASFDNLSFSAELSIDGTRYLSAKSEYSYQNKSGLVSLGGSVEVPELPQTDWLLAWLQSWQNIPSEHWPEQPQTGSAEANWQLQGPRDERFLALATGKVNIHAQVPQPWPVPGVGSIRGNAEVALEADKGQWLPGTLQADLVLDHPAAWVTKVPELLRPDSLTLSVRPASAIASSSDTPTAKTASEQAQLPLNVKLDSRGGANVSIQSHLAIATQAPWMVQLGKTHITAHLPELEAAGWLLTKPKVQVALTGWLNTTDAALKLGAPSVLSVDRLEPLHGAANQPEADIRLAGLKVDLAQAGLNAHYQPEQDGLDKISLSGPVVLKAKQVSHPQLLPQSWQFSGKLNSTLARTDLVGVLKANTGTTINLDLNLPYQGPLRLEGNLRVSGEREANALPKLFTAWPELLTVSAGTVSANAIYELPENGAMRLGGKLAFIDWSGTYDRTALSKMNGSLEFALEGDCIRVATPELTIEEVNAGMPVGPVRIAGHYQAPLTKLSGGQLTLEHATTGALGGQVQIQPGSWDLAQAPVRFPVELTELSLARLLQLYPAEGVAGTGILSGTVPVLFDPATGIRVERGRIDALKPGGRLQVTAERLKALASQSESMKLVAQALENFRYSVLDSGINYDENGTLVLELHLEGNSTEVGEGQPLVLNINLEENIPALLTSLQLSGRVSDAVAERVKRILEKRERDSGDLLK
ncbi:MAG TPA: YdbH domain-containing protein [Marinobacter sp.]|nr:YdbH domain-containing protein [Marinobacter sp.]